MKKKVKYKKDYKFSAIRDVLNKKFPKLVEPRDVRAVDEFLTEDEITMYTNLPHVDECVFGDVLVPDDIEEALEQIAAQEALASYVMKSNNGVEANVIMDFFVLWGTTEDGIEFNKLPESRMMNAAKHCHDYFRNRGEGYSEINTDSYINVSLGNVHYINVNEVWPDVDYHRYGLAHSGTNGVPHRAAYEYCKNLAGTTGDGTRYTVLLPHKISSSTSIGTILGFAYVAASATAWNAGNVTIGGYTGLTSGGLKGSKTLIHETGHSFGLWHTFQFTPDDCNIGTTPCETAGDRVCDTPTENRIPSSPCFATNPNNHMSYSSHTNRIMFTPGQISRMVATLLARFPKVWENPRVYWPDEVTGVDLPVVELNINPLQLEQGDSLSIQWNVTGADTIESYGFDAQGQFNGSIILQNVQESGEIRVVGRNVAGPAQQVKTYNVNIPVPLPVVAISVSPDSVENGGSVTVTWSASNVDSISVTGFRATGYNGSTTIDNVTQNGEVTITGRNSSGEITASAQYSVIEVPVSLPQLISIEQPDPVGSDGLGILDIQFRDTDEITLILKNTNGEYTHKHIVEKVVTPPQPSDLIASFKGDNFDATKGWLDSVSGRYAVGSAEGVSDENGRGVRFKRDGTQFLEFEGLSHSDYTYHILCKFEGTMDNVRALISKRLTHSNNQSWFFLFTWTGNTLYWDNTTNANRLNSGLILPTNEMLDIVASRDLGLFVDETQVTEKGNPNLALVNNDILRIGSDPTAANRGMGGIIYSIDIYNKSKEIVIPK